MYRWRDIIVLMPKLKKFLALLLATIIFSSFFHPLVTQAQITDCDAVFSPNQVNPGSTTTFTVTITNGSAVRIRYLKLTRPSTNFTLDTITATNWTITQTANDFTISGGTINTGASRNFTLNNVIAANVNAPSANWIVAASDANDGSNPYSCTGTLGVQIGTPDTTPPEISGISVSNITTTSATVSWTTNELSDSRVDYGTSISYGLNVTDSLLTTTHSINLTGLTAGTGYHFRIQSKDPSNNIASSSDNTFLTQSVSVAPIPTTTTSTISVTTTEEPSVFTDVLPPNISLTTNFQVIYKETPTIVGTVSDNVAVVKIEYSTDGGANWLPVDTSVGLNTPQASFEFTPFGLPDGDYDIFVRAADPSENIGVSEKSVLVIDNLPPLIGPNMLSFGSQIIPTQSDTITAVIGVDEKITLGTIGGPTSLVIKASSTNNNEIKYFSLTQAGDPNLWSGILAFEKVGTYSLEATAIDGANNKTSKKLNTVVVNKPSQVLTKAQKPISEASVTINYFDEESSSWFVWDGATFGQSNPQTTGENGEFDFFLPTGKYYLNVKAKGYASKNSEIFEKKEPGPLAATIHLDKAISFQIGNWTLQLPNLSFSGIDIGVGSNLAKEVVDNNLVGKVLPTFELPTTEKTSFNSLNLSGKPSLLTFVSTWSPATEEQIAQLQSLAGKSKYNIFVISSLESVEKVRAYKKIGNYNLNFLVDTNGNSLNQLSVLTQPAHIFLKRDLTIQYKTAGVLSEDQLRQRLNEI